MYKILLYTDDRRIPRITLTLFENRQTRVQRHFMNATTALAYDYANHAATTWREGGAIGDVLAALLKIPHTHRYARIAIEDYTKDDRSTPNGTA